MTVSSFSLYIANYSHPFFFLISQDGLLAPDNIFYGMGKYKTLSQPLKLHKEGSDPLTQSVKGEVSCHEEAKRP